MGDEEKKKGRYELKIPRIILIEWLQICMTILWDCLEIHFVKAYNVLCCIYHLTFSKIFFATIESHLRYKTDLSILAWRKIRRLYYFHFNSMPNIIVPFSLINKNTFCSRKIISTNILCSVFTSNIQQIHVRFSIIIVVKK